MKSKKAVSMFVTITFIGASALLSSSAWAAQGNLMFHGHLVNAGCEAQVVDVAGQPTQWKTLQAGKQITVGLAEKGDACSKTAVPVLASFVERSTAMIDEHVGIVTLTYQ